MANNDWNNLGRDIKDIVQDALDTGNFNRLNRDLGATLEDALSNVANAVWIRAPAIMVRTPTEGPMEDLAPAGLTRAAPPLMTGATLRAGFRQGQDTAILRQNV